MDRIILKANKGMVLTDGKVFGKTIYLGDGRNKEDFYEITETEFCEKTESEVVYDRESALA